MGTGPEGSISCARQFGHANTTDPGDGVAMIYLPDCKTWSCTALAANRRRLLTRKTRKKKKDEKMAKRREKTSNSRRSMYTRKTRDMAGKRRIGYIRPKGRSGITKPAPHFSLFAGAIQSICLWPVRQGLLQRSVCNIHCTAHGSLGLTHLSSGASRYVQGPGWSQPCYLSASETTSDCYPPSFLTATSPAEHGVYSAPDGQFLCSFHRDDRGVSSGRRC